MTQPGNDEFLLLVDPEWRTGDDDGDPPFEAVIGMWPRDPDGTTGPFRPNPEYVPRFADSPADPLDAALRLVPTGDVEPDLLGELVRGSLVELAMNGDGRPMVVRSDDGVLCATVATSAVHRQRLFSPEWRQVGAAELLDVLAADTDVLVNPGSPAHVRLAYEFLRQTVANDEAQS